MSKQLTDEEIEEKLREFFEENFHFLSESSGHTINAFMKEKAFQQVLYYWKKNRDLIDKITRSEVKLSLPEQSTPNDKYPYTIEGIVDIVQEKGETWLYDLKTHDVDRILANKDLYKEQLYVYAYIWKNLQEHDLDNTAVISTPLPKKLQQAIRYGKIDSIEREVKEWNPIIPIGYSEDEVAEMIENFGNIVEKIENREFSAPAVETLLNKPDGMKNAFAVHICRNCDLRYSCHSYEEYLIHSKGATKNKMFEFLNARSAEQDDFIEGNLTVE